MLEKACIPWGPKKGCQSNAVINKPHFSLKSIWKLKRTVVQRVYCDQKVANYIIKLLYV